MFDKKKLNPMDNKALTRELKKHYGTDNTLKKKDISRLARTWALSEGDGWGRKEKTEDKREALKNEYDVKLGNILNKIALRYFVNIDTEAAKVYFNDNAENRKKDKAYLSHLALQVTPCAGEDWRDRLEGYVIRLLDRLVPSKILNYELTHVYNILCEAVENSIKKKNQ